jgi:hypothetical protein
MIKVELLSVRILVWSYVTGVSKLAHLYSVLVL